MDSLARSRNCHKKGPFLRLYSLRLPFCGLFVAFFVWPFCGHDVLRLHSLRLNVDMSNDMSTFDVWHMNRGDSSKRGDEENEDAKRLTCRRTTCQTSTCRPTCQTSTCQTFCVFILFVSTFDMSPVYAPCPFLSDRVCDFVWFPWFSLRHVAVPATCRGVAGVSSIHMSHIWMSPVTHMNSWIQEFVCVHT